MILGIAVLAAVATPTPDPITMSLAMGPLIVLFELSILLAAWLDRIRPIDAAEDENEGDDEGHAEPEALEAHESDPEDDR